MVLLISNFVGAKVYCLKVALLCLFALNGLKNSLRESVKPLIG